MIALHNAQTNPAIATEAKRTRIFANRNSVGDSVGLALQCPKMQAVLWWLLLGQHFVAAQFHQIASTLVDVKQNIFFVKASTSEVPASADELPLVQPHILGRSLSLLGELEAWKAFEVLHHMMKCAQCYGPADAQKRASDDTDV